MKFLTVCDGGNVRSVALAFWLKHFGKHEAIAIGRLTASSDTMNMLTSWSDRIILMQPHMIESIREDDHHKVIVCDVGPDRWGVFIHPELWVQILTFIPNLAIPPEQKEFVFGKA